MVEYNVYRLNWENSIISICPELLYFRYLVKNREKIRRVIHFYLYIGLVHVVFEVM